jgi:hypothetical protein
VRVVDVFVDELDLSKLGFELGYADDGSQESGQRLGLLKRFMRDAA